MKLHNAADVAGMLGKTEDWVARETRAGRIPSVKVGRDRRYTDQHLTAYLASLDRPRGGNPWGVKSRRTA